MAVRLINASLWKNSNLGPIQVALIFSSFKSQPLMFYIISLCVPPKKKKKRLQESNKKWRKLWGGEEGVSAHPSERRKSGMSLSLSLFGDGIKLAQSSQRVINTEAAARRRSALI